MKEGKKQPEGQGDVGTVKRRDFLKQAGLVFGTAGAAAVMAKTTEAEAADVKTAGGGYQETEHVRTYYELAKF